MLITRHFRYFLPHLFASLLVGISMPSLADNSGGDQATVPAPLTLHSAYTRHLVTGSLTRDHIAALDAALVAHPDLKEIELIDIPGASGIAPEIAYQFQWRINQHQLHTFARGECASTCAYKQDQLPTVLAEGMIPRQWNRAQSMMRWVTIQVLSGYR